MASLIVLYTPPTDREGFDAHYRDVHIPIAESLPGVQTVKASRIIGTPRGGEGAFYLQAELTFADNESMTAALRSDEGMQTSRDAMQMCQTYGSNAEILLAEDF